MKTQRIQRKNSFLRIKRGIFDPVILLSLQRVIDNWKAMLLWTILVWVLMAMIFGPLSSLFLSMRIFRGGRLLVSNLELINWIKSPAGIAYIFFAFIMMLIGIIVRFAGIFQIVSDAREGARTSIFHTFLNIIAKLPAIAKVSFFVVIAALILMFLCIIGLGIVYAIFLANYDINYYLNTKPAEWYTAMIIAIIWLFMWFIGASYLFARVVLIVPACLDGYNSLQSALLKAWYLAKDRAGRLIKLLIITTGLWLSLALFLDAVIYFAASFIIQKIADISSSLRLVVLFSGLYVFITLIVRAMTSFFGFSLVSTVITKYYYDDTNLHDSAPVTSKLLKLKAKTISLLSYLLRPKYLVPLTGVLFIVCIFASGIMLERIPHLQRVKIVAHRGGPPPAPENTLSALESAINAGAEYAEIDVQLTRDTVVVVVHDADLMRVARDSRRISQTDYHDIAGLVQTPDDGSHQEERRIATLQDFINKANKRINLMIELKYYNSQPELVKEVINLIEENNVQEQSMIISLDSNEIKKIREFAPSIKTGFVSAVTLGELSQLPVNALIINKRRVNAQLLRRARQQNMEVYVWTVNSVELMAEMIELGVDGIITDYPQLAARVREELTEMTAVERLLLRFRKFMLKEEELEFAF